MNRLQYETSPYLRQHADNPVDWYPWGEEAFEKARAEGKPVFLSIGYSTCHWCHVMERESFENEAIAGYLKEHFVSVKVDREERPEIDYIYMQTVLAMTGRGGWPLSVFLTPDRKPVYGGTYFPPQARWGSPGFLELLQFVSSQWARDSQHLARMGNEITALVRQRSEAASHRNTLDPDHLHSAFHQLKSRFDPQHGGFGGAPKFPMPHTLSFLLHYWKRSGSREVLDIVDKTLTCMARGGIHDQLAGGFHRYSTDAFWQTPHFEKMLYDQALLARTYLEGFSATGKAEHAATARGVLDYVLTAMRDPQGGFYSAEDADSPDPSLDALSGDGKPAPVEKKEGAFYVWSKSETDRVLTEDESRFAAEYYGLHGQGNVMEDPHGEFAGKNVLFTARTLDDAARRAGLDPEQAEEALSLVRRKLLQARSRRPRPDLDDKVLTDWNGLMMAALAYACRVLGDRIYLEEGRRTADFIWDHLRRPDGRLLHRYRAGESGLSATLDDYAFFIYGLIELYQAGWNPFDLKRAVILTENMLRLFHDDSRGGFYLTAGDHEELIFRPREVSDGALPSGNAVAVTALQRLYDLTGEPKYQKVVTRALERISGDITANPSAFSQSLMALDVALGPGTQIVIVDEPGGDLARQVFQKVHEKFDPYQTIVFKPLSAEDPDQALIEELCPSVQRYPPVDGQPAVYVCRDHSCRRPVTTIEEFIRLYEC